MFSFFTKSSTNNPIKGFKVALNRDRSKKYGIAANSLEMLRNKIIAKFNLKSFINLYIDGSLLDNEEYFLTVPAQSLVIIGLEGEEVKTGR